MSYTTKHGQWFPFSQHIQIHDDVLAKYESAMIVPQEYSLNYLSHDVLEHSVEFEFSHNGYRVKIEKESYVKFSKNSVTGKFEPTQALTKFYNYVAWHSDKGHHIRYCSPHEENYRSDLPWHHKHHSHESWKKNQDTVKIYSNDDRPFTDRSKIQFTVDRSTVKINYLGEIDWPNVKDFLKQVHSFAESF
jgi:hypothetical protein